MGPPFYAETKEGVLMKSLGYVYSGTVGEDSIRIDSRCGDKKFCRIFTETTICVLDSADADLVTAFKNKLKRKKNDWTDWNFLTKMSSYFDAENFNFQVNPKPQSNPRDVRLLFEESYVVV